MRRAPLKQRNDFPPLFTGLPAIVWILCGVFIATMLTWSVVRATYNAPDEREHVAAALYWSGFHEWPAPGEMYMMLDVMRSSDLVEEWATDAVEVPADKPSFTELSTDQILSGQTRNQMSQHPPLYYLILGELHELIPANVSAESEVWVFRLFSITIMAPLPVLAAALARRLGATRPLVVCATALVALLPGLASLGGAVNNDNLLNAACAWALLGMGCVLAGDFRRRTAVWIGVALAIALLTKAFAIPVALGVGIAYVVATLRFGKMREGLTALVITIGIASLGGWWWFANIIRYGSVQPAATLTQSTETLSVVEALLAYLSRFNHVFLSRFWAGYDPPEFSHPTYWMPLIVSVGVLSTLLLGIWRGRKSAPFLTNIVVLLMPAALVFLLLVASTFRITMSTGYAAGVQGRYLYCALLGLAVATVLAYSKLVHERRLPLTMVVLVASGLALSMWRVVFGLVHAWGVGEGALMHATSAGVVGAAPPSWVVTVILVFFSISLVLSIILVAREFRLESSAVVREH